MRADLSLSPFQEVKELHVFLVGSPGFEFYVIAVKQRPTPGQLDFLDTQELQSVAGGNDISVYTRIDRYDQLQQPLFEQVKERLLCIVDPTTTPPLPLDNRKFEYLFLPFFLFFFFFRSSD